MSVVAARRTRRSIPRSRRIALCSALALSAALLPLSGCESSWGGKRYKETRTLELPHIAGSALSIENANGAIEALATDRADVSLEVTLYSGDLERLRFANVRADRQGDGTLRVWIEWPGGKRANGEGAAISINLPDAEGVHARTSNGTITIAGLGGDADLQTSNGNIRVDTQDGSVLARTSNGSLYAKQISGDLEMYSSNGNINIDDAFGPIRAESTNGSAVVTTMPGNVGPVRIRTSNGSVTLNLGVGFEGVLKCDTSNGKVTVSNLPDAKLIETSNRRVELQLGESSEISAVRTSNGSVRVRGR